MSALHSSTRKHESLSKFEENVLRHSWVSVQEEYLNLVLPVIKDTLRWSAKLKDAESQKSALDKQAEQRKKILEKMKHKQEDMGGIFKVSLPAASLDKYN